MYQQLSAQDEPQRGSALVAVYFGVYWRQEIWVRSGANPGTWYCLGGEFGAPKVWDDNVPASLWNAANKTPLKRPPNTIPAHPCFADILARGPVTLLLSEPAEAYHHGWASGVRAAQQRIEAALESLEDDIPSVYKPKEEQ